MLTNDDIAQLVDTNDEWIRDRVGIVSRRIADGETVADMATAAAGKALANSGPHRRRHRPGRGRHLHLDRPLPQRGRPGRRQAGHHRARARSTSTPPAPASPTRWPPSTTPSGPAPSRNALVIGAEKLSDVTDWTDRSTCIIFGDGAGAAVVTATADGEPAGIGPVVWGSAPEKGDAVRIEGWRPYIEQEGQAVFRWATTALAPLALAGLRAGRRRPVRAGRVRAAPGQHADHRRHRQAARHRRNAIIAKDIVESGNTSAASVPLALSKLVERREVPSGAPVLLFGFGGGLTYAGQVVRCP